MKKILLLAAVTLSFLAAHAAGNSIDSLQNKITSTSSDSLKAVVYTKMALGYMGYPTIQDKSLKTEYQEKALKYTFNALHSYSRLDDSTNLRICYDRLAKIYRDQHKYSPAKWYILQANIMARAQNDLPSVTESLITLAAIKMDAKNYDWAEADLGEALEISSTNRFSEQQANVMLSYARLWKNVRRPIQASGAMARYNFMEDSMEKDSIAKDEEKVVIKKKQPVLTTRLAKVSVPKTATVYTSL